MSASQNKVIQYFFAPHSPWTYLGHARVMAIAKKQGAQIDVRPFGSLSSRDWSAWTCPFVSARCSSIRALSRG